MLTVVAACVMVCSMVGVVIVEHIRFGHRCGGFNTLHCIANEFCYRFELEQLRAIVSYHPAGRYPWWGLRPRYATHSHDVYVLTSLAFHLSHIHASLSTFSLLLTQRHKNTNTLHTLRSQPSTRHNYTITHKKAMSANNQNQPGLVASHAQYVKGAAEVLIPSDHSRSFL